MAVKHSQPKPVCIGAQAHHRHCGFGDRNSISGMVYVNFRSYHRMQRLVVDWIEMARDMLKRRSCDAFPLISISEPDGSGKIVSFKLRPPYSIAQNADGP